MFEWLRLWWNLRKLSRASSWSRRGDAATALGELGDERAVERLVKALGDDGGEVRRAAAEALARLGQPVWQGLIQGDSEDFGRLGESGEPRAYEPLIKALGDGDRPVQRAACEGLGKLGDARAVEALIEALATFGAFGEGVRRAAAEALGKLADARALEPLIHALGDPDDDVRRAAAEGLGRLGDARAVEPLIKALADDDWRVPGAAAEALGRLADPRAVVPLIQALGHGSGRAAEALGRLGDARAVVPLIKALGDGDRHIRRAASEALARLGQPVWQGLIQGDSKDFGRLGESGDPRAFKPLIKALGDSDEDVRCLAAEALGNLGDVRALQPLMQALWDSKSKLGVRVAAAKAIGKVKGDGAIQALFRALGDSDRQVHNAAWGALQGFDAALLVEPFIGALGDPNETVRSSAAKALGELANRQAVGPLLKALEDTEVAVRSAAAEALGMLGDACAVDPLMNALADCGHNVRFAAAEALGGLRDTRAVDPLVVLLAEDSWGIRRAAAEALGKLGDKRATRSLLPLLADCESHVRRAAAGALAQLGEPQWAALVTGHNEDFARLALAGDARLLKPMVKALGAPHNYTRRAAAEALIRLAAAPPAEMVSAWAEIRERITHPHKDTPASHFDEDSDRCGHVDYASGEHHDIGIGLEFPQQPPTRQPDDVPSRDSSPTVSSACPNPGCRKTLKVRAELLGRRVRCPSCGTIFVLPGGPRAAADARPDF